MFLEFLQATLFGRHPGTFPKKPELFRERVGIAHLVDVQTGDGHGAAVVFFEKQGGEPEGEMEHEGLGIVVQVPQIEQQLGQGRERLGLGVEGDFIVLEGGREVGLPPGTEEGVQTGE